MDIYYDTHIDGLAVQCSSISQYMDGIIFKYAAGLRHVVKNCLIEFVTPVDDSVGIYADFGSDVTPGSEILMYNNIVYDVNHGTNTDLYGIYVNQGWKGDVYNNTVHNCRKGISVSSNADVTLINNIFNDCTDEDLYNVSDANTIGGYNVCNYGISDGVFGVKHSTGTATSYSASHLVDTSATFQTDNVQVGSIVENDTDSTYAYVTTINSETDLTLSSDIFDTGNEAYTVYTNMYGSVTFEDEGSDDFHLGSSDTVAKGKGYNLSTHFTTDIDGQARP